MNAYTVGYAARAWLCWNPWSGLWLLAMSSWMSGYADAEADAASPPIRREDLRLEPECRGRVA